MTLDQRIKEVFKKYPKTVSTLHQLHHEHRNDKSLKWFRDSKECQFLVGQLLLIMVKERGIDNTSPVEIRGRIFRTIEMLK